MNNPSNMSASELWGLVADTVGILAFVFFFKSQLDDAVKTLQLPPRYDFYFVSFWAFVAAVTGGFVWNSILVRIVNYANILGGSGNEPQGVWAFLWPVITLLPTITILLIGNKIYPFMPIRQQLLLYIAFLAGISIGSALFYNLPIGNTQGLRRYFEVQNLSFFRKEFILVVAWTALLSTGFLFVMFVKLLTIQNLNPSSAVYSFLRQAGITILFTTLAVVFFLLAFPSNPQFDSARGIVAGLFLRIAIFWGLLLA